MNTPRFAAAALISALAAAPAFSQPVLTPISMGPAGTGQCVIGSEGCGSAGSAMDPISEGALVGLGQSMIPALGAPHTSASGSAAGGAAAKKAPSIAKTTGDAEDPGADLVAIGGQIINPLGGAAPGRGANGLALGAVAATSQPTRQATFDTHIDGSPVPTPTSAKATGLSYIHSQKVESTIGGNATAFGTDPKLSAGDADFGSGGTRASANGSR
jgi:hypothetical protein